MKFPSDPDLEGLVGRVCLIFARVEQEAGHAVAAAHGHWGEAVSTDYLDYSASSGRLLDWLKVVAKAYPEVNDKAKTLTDSLRALKKERDAWAHSAAIIDMFLMMKEQGKTKFTDSDIERGKLLNAKSQGHINAPTQADVDGFERRASEVGDLASALGNELAQIYDSQPREVRVPPGRVSDLRE